jgi:Ca2+-dependent lipid-binding protein
LLNDSILVFPEQVKSKECLSVQLWDSDRLTADDMVGKIEFDLHELILNGGKLEYRTDKLAGDREGTEMPGELHWEVGYFAKADFNKALHTDGNDIRVPKEYTFSVKAD